jgi:hypothetical protein
MERFNGCSERFSERMKMAKTPMKSTLGTHGTLQRAPARIRERIFLRRTHQCVFARVICEAFHVFHAFRVLKNKRNLEISSVPSETAKRSMRSEPGLIHG